MEHFEIAGTECTLLLPDGYEEEKKRYPVIYMNGELPLEPIREQVKKQHGNPKVLFVSVKSENWGRDFTPWRAEAVRKGENPPEGKADAYIKKLTEQIKPYIDTRYRTKTEPEETLLLGYSLGGLAALYSLYKTAVFGKAGSISGSLWYDNFLTYAEENAEKVSAQKVYLSLGKQEPKSRNRRMGTVGECTEKLERLLAEKIGTEKVYMEWNNGGHFDDVAERIAKAAVWLLRESEHEMQ